jgi:hypothetical protein
MTNVPGPRQPLYFAGQELKSVMFWVPQSGKLGLGISLISYNGQVRLGVTTDAGLVPDPEAIIDAFHREFADFMALVEQVTVEPDRCRATTRSGQPCKNKALPNSNYCHLHQPAAASGVEI